MNETESYVKVVSQEFSDTVKLAQLISEVTGFIIEKTKQSHDACVAFLLPEKAL